MKISIGKDIVNDLRSWFFSYLKRFSHGNEEYQRNINIKLEHSERVSGEIIRIGIKTGLKGDELLLAEIIGLYHDIGRFEQYDRYGTFSDFKSENHAELGIKILTRHNVLSGLDDEIQKLILCSIKYHNRAILPTLETDECLFWSKLIRDADKLDIWKVVTEYYHRKNGGRNITLELELPETPGISQKVYNSLINKKIVDMRVVRNVNDIKLLQAGLVYDINFQASFEFIKERRYIESLRSTLPADKKISEIFDIINSYIEEKCGNFISSAETDIRTI